MTAHIAQLWRFPIKSHGREALDSVRLEAGQTMPGDRVWAVAHDAAKVDFDVPAWAPCANFSRGAKAPGLMAISARLNKTAGTLTLSHPDQDDLTFDPDTAADEARFIAWVTPLCPPERALPARLFKVPGRGLTDTDYPSISLNSLSTHAVVQEKLGRRLSPQRWRGNIHFDGLAPGAEYDWIGKRLRLGEAEIAVREPIGRCLATSASTRTGKRDADTLGALQNIWGHQNFGVYAEVVSGGEIHIGNEIEVIG